MGKWGVSPDELYNENFHPVGKLYYRITTLRDSKVYEIKVSGGDGVREKDAFIASQKQHLSLGEDVGQVKVEFEIVKNKNQALRLKA